jgi:hypothetical protein
MTEGNGGRIILMETTSLVKTFKIEYDPITGTIDYKNDDNLTYAEVLGAIEYVKMMITKAYIEDTD